MNTQVTWACLIPDGDTFILAGVTNFTTTTPIFGLVEKYSSTGEFIEYLPSLTPREPHIVRYYACGTFEDGQGDKAYMAVSARVGMGDSTTEVLFQNANAWVPGPQVPYPNSWLFAKGYNLAPDRLLLVYGSERMDEEELSEVYQLSPDGTGWMEVGSIGRLEFAAAVADLASLCG